MGQIADWAIPIIMSTEPNGTKEESLMGLIGISYGYEVQDHVLFVHVRVAYFEGATLMPEDLKSKRGVEAFCRGLSGVHGKRNPLQAGLGSAPGGSIFGAGLCAILFHAQGSFDVDTPYDALVVLLYLPGDG